MSAEITKSLYEGKFFYEIVKTGKEVERMLIGPVEGIRYTMKLVNQYVPDEGAIIIDNNAEYAFVQVINGVPRVSFTKDQILVLDRKI